jgi:hypothetical protein
MSWRIEKKGYSAKPWRLISADGQELGTVCTNTGVSCPVSGNTRADIERWVLERLEWYVAHAKNGLIPSIYSANWRTTAMLENTATVVSAPPPESAK